MANHEFTLMGVVNVTPDSFSDGGALPDAQAAIAHGLSLVEQGATIVDVGGESTRPGAEPVTEAEELARVLPVIEGLAAHLATRPDVRLSIDTAKAAVAAEALRAGATIVNDVTALRGDSDMAALIAQSNADCCLMHMQGQPRTMQLAPHYDDVLHEVRSFLEERLHAAIDAGIDARRVMLDPGIGFGKTVQHNLTLIAGLQQLAALGPPLVIGTSRKQFLGRMASPRGEPQDVPPRERLPGTIATNVMALERGARIFRVHDVAPLRDALTVAAATLSGRWTAPTPPAPSR